MPIYEYKCNKCGKIFDVFSNYKADKEKSCIELSCEGKAERIISKSNAVFKGKGFYATDSKPNITFNKERNRTEENL